MKPISKPRTWTLVTLALALAAISATGPGCHSQSNSKGEDRDAPPTAPPPRSSQASNAFTLKSDLLEVTKHVPEKATLRSTIVADLTIAAVANCAQVVITDTIPAGSTYVKSEPAAQIEGKTLTWTFPRLDKGQTLQAKVWYVADTEGVLFNCTTMTALPRECVETFVGKPTISVEKTGPETAKLGTAVAYRIVVKNTGNADAENVVVTDTVPVGMSHPDGKTLTFKLGTLAAGQSKEIPVTLSADARGKHSNLVSVATSNAGTAKDEAATLVIQPGLVVTKAGTPEQFLGRDATYQIVVNNIGDTELKEVVITDKAQPPTKIVSALGATISGNTATWTLARLAKGEKQTREVVVTSETSGRFCNSVAVAAEGLKASAEACTDWKGVAAILLETKDDPDPIEVGDSVTYLIRVTNQGTANDRNVKVMASFGKEISPVSASAGGKVDGSSVSFTPLATLGAKQVVTYTITAKGVAIGDHRLKVSLSSEVLSAPVVHEESTRVY